MSFAAADTGTSRTKTITRHLDAGADDFVHVPVEAPSNKPQVTPGLRANACDIGIFDEKGTDIGGEGIRGRSGGFRTEFNISTAEATPDHLPGPVGKGTGNTALGSFQVSEQGLDYTVNVTLEYGPDGAAYRPPVPAATDCRTRGGPYRGDAHLHTVYSHGRRTPDEVAGGR
jgi:hypothetical protein